MVDKLCGFNSEGQAQKYKFVHQLPLVVDVDGNDSSIEARSLLGQETDGQIQVASTSTTSYNTEACRTSLGSPQSFAVVVEGSKSCSSRLHMQNFTPPSTPFL
jgi:hypothetical protein